MSEDVRLGSNYNMADATGAKTAYNLARGMLGVVVPRYNGAMQVMGKSITWHTCREQFHANLITSRQKGFFYVTDPDHQSDVAHFMYHIENTLKLENKSWFKYTERGDAVWVEAENWWHQNPMRLQFFTICLRAALGWKRHRADLRNQLFSYHYASSTRDAVERFFNGYTWYTGSVVGWHRQFAGYSVPTSTAYIAKPTDSELKRLLVLPDYERKRRIEETAYFKWVNSGMPYDTSGRFYRDAEDEVNRQEAA